MLALTTACTAGGVSPGEPKMKHSTAPWLVAPPSMHGWADRPAPTVTVIVPAYQASATIVEALQSVFHQTVPPEQIVVCDDGSTDGLAGALAPFMDRIRFIRQPNRGSSAARNRA